MNGAEPAATTEGTAVRGAPSGARRALRWLAVAVGGTVGIAAVGLYVAHRRADATFDEHRAIAQRERETLAATARGRPALLEPAIPGDARRMIEAFLAAVAAVPESEKHGLPSWGLAGHAPDAEQDEILARHPGPLAALEPILQQPRAPAALPASIEDAGARATALREGERWLVALGDRALARGEGARARRVGFVHAAYGCDAAGGGSPLETCVACAFVARGASILRRALALAPVDADEARRLGTALDRLPESTPTFEDALAVHRLLAREAISRAADGPEPHISAKLENASLWRWAWSRRLCAADALGRLDTALSDAVRSDAPERDDPNPIFEGWSLSWLDDSISEGRANLVVTRVAVAVAGFASEQGRLPASLEELVPAWLPRVPLDPFDGRPLRYAEGRVWSVGDDGTDDRGGVERGIDDIVAPAPAAARPSR